MSKLDDLRRKSADAQSRRDEAGYKMETSKDPGIYRKWWNEYKKWQNRYHDIEAEIARLEREQK
jgi:hypothetical protein